MGIRVERGGEAVGSEPDCQHLLSTTTGDRGYSASTKARHVTRGANPNYIKQIQSFKFRRNSREKKSKYINAAEYSG